MSLRTVLILLVVLVCTTNPGLVQGRGVKETSDEACQPEETCARTLATAAALGGTKAVKVFLVREAFKPSLHVYAFTERGVFVAAGSGNEGFVSVQVILDQGIDIDTRDEPDGSTALMSLDDLSTSSQKKAAEALVAAGADVNAVNEDGKTALMVASMYGFFGIAKVIVRAGADIDQMSTDGTALIIAARYGRRAILRILLEAGADIDAQDDYGWTALMSGCFLGDTEIVQELLNAGADTDATSNKGKSALDIAATHGHTQVLELLE